MKRLILFFAIVSTVLIVTFISMSNLTTLNLLFDNSNYSTSLSSQFNVNGEDEEGETYNPTKEGASSDLNEMLQSGLMAGGGGTGGLNLLWLLQNAKDPDTNSYAYQLLQAYSNLENGKYNNFEYHIPVTGLAASHKNETNLASFVVPSTSGHGTAETSILGRTVNGKTVTLENAVKSDIVGNVTNTGKGVWYNEKGEGDSCPDGPFQIIQCSPVSTKNLSNVADKTRGGSYDLYSFVDAMNVKDYKYNEVAPPFIEANLGIDPRVINMLNAITHNRGEAGGISLMYGFGYNGDYTTTKGFLKRPASSYASLEPSDLKEVAAFPTKLLKWIESTNIPIEDIPTDNSGAQGLGTLITLANGGFLDIPLMSVSKRNILAQTDKTISTLFPGQSKKTIVDHINNNYVKKPWDMYGVSKAEYKKIFGVNVDTSYEQDYAIKYNFNRNTVFYIHEDIKSQNYVHSQGKLLSAVEGIALGYITHAGSLGESTLLNIAITAGIKSLNNGTLVDPTNPQTMYQRLAPESSGSYSPVVSSDGDFGQLMDYLGLNGTMTPLQQEMIKKAYEISGNPYSQPRRGTSTPKGLTWMDCSWYTTYVINLGQFKHGTAYNTTRIGITGELIKSSKKTNDVNGQTYTHELIQLDKQGNPLIGQTKLNKSIVMKGPAWGKVVQAGDIIVNSGYGSGGGHVYIAGGTNNSGKTIVIPNDICKSSPKNCTVKAGQDFIFHSSHFAYGGGTNNTLSGLMPMAYNKGTFYTSRDLHAFRTAYVVKEQGGL